MKYILSLIVGLVCGLLLALAVIYYNPMTVERTSTLEASTTLRYALSADGTIASTHGGSLRLDLKPAEIAQLWEATISKAALNLLVMTNESLEPVAIASRMSKLSERTNVVSSGLILADSWLVTIPGQGSFIVEVENNLWPIVRDTLVDVDLLKRPWIGHKFYEATVGPETNGTAAMTGATGAFRGTYGSAADVIELDDYAAGHGLDGLLHGALHLRIMTAASAENEPSADAPTEILR